MKVDQNNLMQNILSAICNMNVEALQLHLPDDQYYIEMNKETFLLKVTQLFDSLKEQGNTCFTIHSGTCNSSLCNNKGCKGYVFVSDVTKEHISIVLHYIEDKVTDWSHCHDLLTNDLNLDEDKDILIHVWHEERYDFEADDEFLQTISDVKHAKILLNDMSQLGITKASLLMWLDRYENLFLNNYYFKNYKFKFYKLFSEFGKLFYILVDLGKIVKNESKVISIIDEMKFTKRKRHLQLFDENKELLSTVFRADIYSKNGKIQLSSDSVVYVFDYQNFEELFDYMKLSYDLIYKYTH